MTKIKITDDEIVKAHIVRELAIAIGEQGETVLYADKTADWGDCDETDWAWSDDVSEKKYKELDEETQEAVVDIINDYTMKL